MVAGRRAFLAAALAVPDGSAVRRIEERFMAPCCWTQNLAVHDSPEAREMRAEIARLAAGQMTEEQIVDRFVARYGERILREPRGARSFWLHATPIAAILLGGAGLAGFLYRRRAAVPADSHPAQPVSDEEIDW